MSLEPNTREDQDCVSLRPTCKAIVAALASTHLVMRSDPTDGTADSSSVPVSVPHQQLEERGLPLGEPLESSVDVEDASSPELLELVQLVDTAEVNPDNIPGGAVPTSLFHTHPTLPAINGAPSINGGPVNGDFTSLQQGDVASMYDFPAIVRAVSDGIASRGEAMLLVLRGVRNIFVYELSDSRQLRTRLGRYFGDVLANLLQRIYPDRGETPVVSGRKASWLVSEQLTCLTL